MYIKIIPLFLLLISCGRIEYVYKDKINSKNELYGKTTILLSGVDIPFFFSKTIKYFGEDNKKIYLLKINTREEKIKRSVQSNQAVSKLDYKLFFVYELFSVEKKCLINRKEIISRFTFEPQAAGYNFGSDESLNILYETAANDSLQQFELYLSNIDIDSCQ